MATVRTYDAADLGRVLALWDGQVDVDDALQAISSVNGVALVADVDTEIAELLLDALETRPSLSEEIGAGFAADVRGFARD